jgi:NAD(P)H-dependent FMN reductase
MMNTHNVLVINGSYRDDGITDQAVEVAVAALKTAGAETEIVNLRDYPIEFCLNCRECTQQSGTSPGKCVLDDGMHVLIDKIEAADAFILAAPTNFSSVTAIFKRFMERLLPYAYWPWHESYPKFRKAAVTKKKAMLVSSSAAPALMGRWLFGTSKQLRTAAQTIGADTVGTLFTGLASKDKHQRLSASTVARAQTMANKLIAS